MTLRGETVWKRSVSEKDERSRMTGSCFVHFLLAEVSQLAVPPKEGGGLAQECPWRGGGQSASDSISERLWTPN